MRFTLFFHLLLLLLALTSCNPDENGDFFTANGSVRYMGADGGCWQVMSDNEDLFTPMNLPEEFQVEDLRIWIEAKYRNDLDPACLSGYVIEIIDIHTI